MTSTEIDALFAETLVGDYESEAAWHAVSKLRLDGNRDTFGRAAAWLTSDEPLQRARAVDVLCQLMRARTPAPDGELPEPEWLFRPESSALIASLLETEQDPVVLAAAVHALGHLDDERAIPLILRFLDDTDEDVRFGVAFALGCFPNDAEAVSGLLKLTSDADADVRDWAVFGLGVQSDVDSPEIREALLHCLDDPNEDVREEAAVGLGKRQEPRFLPALFSLLENPDIKLRVAEAASAMLGLESDPPEWEAGDYKEALERRFPSSDLK